MSGGHFNYQQYVMHDIAMEIKTIISENDSIEQNEFGDDIGSHFPEHIIAEFKTAVDLLKKTDIYVHRIDWLLSGDDGEETFVERLKEELGETKCTRFHEIEVFSGKNFCPECGTDLRGIK